MSENLEPDKKECPQVCPAYAYQEATVSVPVIVKPYVKAGKTQTLCYGLPTVEEGITCDGTTSTGSCAFTITQDICVTVPVEFGAIAYTGIPNISCDEDDDETSQTDQTSDEVKED